MRAREPTGPALEPELLAHDARDLAAVGAPARLAHDVADDDADRLHVPGAQALGDLGVGAPQRLPRAGALTVTAKDVVACWTGPHLSTALTARVMR